MKPLLMCAIIVAALTVSKAFAATGSCYLDGHEENFKQLLVTSIAGKINVDLKKRKGISVNPDSIKLSVQVSQSSIDRVTRYVYMEGEFVTKAGTPMVINFTGTQDWSDGSRSEHVEQFRTVLKSDGFDNEGNPKNGKCFMVFWGDKPTAEITNARTGVLIDILPMDSNFRIF